MSDLPKLRSLLWKAEGKGVFNGCVLEWKGMRLTGVDPGFVMFEREFVVSMAPTRAEGTIKPGCYVRVTRARDGYELLKIGEA